jgi:hypothetical protein
MATYSRSFQLRKWLRLRRCKSCRQQFEAGPSAMFCAACSVVRLQNARLDEPAPRHLSLAAPIRMRVDAHHVWVDAMARDQHGRAMLSAWQLRQHEARLAQAHS